MELYQLEDEFYPMMMKIYQAHYLMEGIMECGPCCRPRGDDVQRQFAYTDLLCDVLKNIVAQAECIAKMMDGNP